MKVVSVNDLRRALIAHIERCTDVRKLLAMLMFIFANKNDTQTDNTDPRRN